MTKQTTNHKNRQRLLNQLLEYGIYGKTHEGIEEYLIRRGLDDLIRAGVLEP